MKKIITAICILIGYFANAQTYNPSNFTVSNKSYGIAQAVSTDARSWFFDAGNFVMRDYQSTTEVNTYLNLAKYRSGHFPIFVHSGGTLNGNGTYTGGITQVYWYKDSTGNANLVRWYTDSTITSGFFAIANNLSEGNATTIKTNLSLQNVDNTSDATKNAAAVTITNHTISGSSNTITNIANGSLTNSTIGISLTATGNDVSIPNPAAALGTNNTLNIPSASASARGVTTSSDWSSFHAKVDSTTVSNDSVYDWHNGAKSFRYRLGLINDSNLFVNGLHVSNDTVKLGGKLIDTVTNIQTHTRLNSSTNTENNYLIVSNVSKDSAKLLNYKYELNGTELMVLRYLSQQQGDTMPNSYSPVLFIRDNLLYDSGATQYTSSNPIRLLQTGAKATSFFFPPAVPSSIYIDQFGNNGSPMVGELGIGERWGYNINIINPSSSNYGALPYSSFYSILDLERVSAVGHKRRITGVGMANYLSNWKSYQHDINSGTLSDSSYINRVVDYYSTGQLRTYPNAPSKSKILAVSMVDTAIGFYSAPKRKDLNEIVNGYGFVQDGLQDYNFNEGKTRMGGIMPTQSSNNMNGVLEVNQSTTGIGSVSVTASGTTVTGTGTLFLYDFNVGDSIYANSEAQRITAIASNTSMTTTAWTSSFSGLYTLSGGNKYLFSSKGTLFFGNATPTNNDGAINITRTYLNNASSVNDIKHDFTISNTTSSPFSNGNIGYFGSTFIAATNTGNHTGSTVGGIHLFSVKSGATGAISGGSGFAAGWSSTIENKSSTFNVGGAINFRAFYNSGAGVISKGVSYLSGGVANCTNSTGLLLQLLSPMDTSKIPDGHFDIYSSTGYNSYLGGTTGKIGIRTSIPQQALHVNGKVQIDTLDASTNGTDSVVVVNNGLLKKAAYINYAHTIFTPTTGGTVNLVNRQYNIINPAGTISTLTVNLPTSPSNNDVVYIKYTQVVTTVTYGNGTVVDGITSPTVGGLVILVYDSNSTSWY